MGCTAPISRRVAMTYDILQALEEMKKEGLINSRDKPSDIVSKHLKPLSESVKGGFNSKNSMNKLVSRRQNKKPIPKNPKKLSKIVLTPEFQELERALGEKEKFCWYDSGPEDKSRMFIFTTKKNMEILLNAPTWFIDGTFKVS